jgi:hypothetical protein
MVSSKTCQFFRFIADFFDRFCQKLVGFSDLTPIFFIFDRKINFEISEMKTVTVQFYFLENGMVFLKNHSGFFQKSCMHSWLLGHRAVDGHAELTPCSPAVHGTVSKFDHNKKIGH